MSAKYWHVLLVAPMALWLTACPSNSQDPGYGSNPSVSKFAGLWVGAKALQDYTDSVSQNRPQAFCESVRRFPNRHGLQAGGQSLIDAWLIQSSGDVFRYSPSLRAGEDNNTYVHDLRIGKVENTGDFNVPGNEVVTNPNGGGQYGLYTQGVHVTDGNFNREDFSHLTMTNNATSRASDYVRTDNQTLINYQAAIGRCLALRGQSQGQDGGFVVNRRRTAAPAAVIPAPSPDDDDDDQLPPK